MSEKACTDLIGGTRDKNFVLFFKTEPFIQAHPLPVFFGKPTFRKMGCCTASSKFRYRHAWKRGCCQADTELDVKW